MVCVLRSDAFRKARCRRCFGLRGDAEHHRHMFGSSSPNRGSSHAIAGKFDCICLIGISFRRHVHACACNSFSGHMFWCEPCCREFEMHGGNQFTSHVDRCSICLTCRFDQPEDELSPTVFTRERRMRAIAQRIGFSNSASRRCQTGLALSRLQPSL